MRTTRFDDLPAVASWRHTGARDGFETVHATASASGLLLRGTTVGVQDDARWALTYEVRVDPDWATRSARLTSRGAGTDRHLSLERDDEGRWRVDGLPRPDLDGLVDVDLAASLLTNTLPLHRLAPGPDPVPAPAVFVDLDLTVGRLEQVYALTVPHRLDYAAPGLDFRTTIEVDDAGLVVRYPPLGERYTPSSST